MPLKSDMCRWVSECYRFERSSGFSRMRNAISVFLNSFAAQCEHEHVRSVVPRASAHILFAIFVQVPESNWIESKLGHFSSFLSFLFSHSRSPALSFSRNTSSIILSQLIMQRESIFNHFLKIRETTRRVLAPAINTVLRLTLMRKNTAGDGWLHWLLLLVSSSIPLTKSNRNKTDLLRTSIDVVGREILFGVAVGQQRLSGEIWRFSWTKHTFAVCKWTGVSFHCVGQIECKYWTQNCDYGENETGRDALISFSN